MQVGYKKAFRCKIGANNALYVRLVILFWRQTTKTFCASKLGVKPKMFLTVDKPLLSRQKHFYAHYLNPIALQTKQFGSRRC